MPKMSAKKNKKVKVVPIIKIEKSESENDNHECILCDNKAFPNLKKYNQHIYNCHNSKTFKFECPICERRFISKTVLDKHQIRIHSWNMNVSSDNYKQRREIFDENEEVKFKIPKNLKTYTKKPNPKKNMIKIKEETQEETEFILPD